MGTILVKHTEMITCKDLGSSIKRIKDTRAAAEASSVSYTKKDEQPLRPGAPCHHHWLKPRIPVLICTHPDSREPVIECRMRRPHCCWKHVCTMQKAQHLVTPCMHCVTMLLILSYSPFLRPGICFCLIALLCGSGALNAICKC